MKRTPKSTRALPEPLRGRDPGTWQHFTVSQRLRAIAGRVVEENPALPSVSADRLATLMAEIPDAPIRFLDDPRAPDAAAWRRYVRPYLGLDWYQPPWFFIEMYFFRRVLEAVGAFRPGPTRGLDPYRRQKLDGLAAAPAALARAAAWSMTTDTRADLMRLLAASAWGNQADMSIWPIGQESGPDGGHLVVDDSERIAAALVGGRGRIALLADNAGVELAADLALIDFLLERSLVESVELHVKPFPTFVSDATLPDVVETALTFAHQGESADVRALGQRLLGALACGQLAIRPHVYWTSPRPFLGASRGLASHPRPLLADHQQGRCQLPPAGRRPPLAVHRTLRRCPRRRAGAGGRPAGGQSGSHGWAGRGPGGCAGGDGSGLAGERPLGDDPVQSVKDPALTGLRTRRPVV